MLSFVIIQEKKIDCRCFNEFSIRAKALNVFFHHPLAKANGKG